jgi:hypothetical protein
MKYTRNRRNLRNRRKTRTKGGTVRSRRGEMIGMSPWGTQEALALTLLGIRYIGPDMGMIPIDAVFEFPTRTHPYFDTSLERALRETHVDDYGPILDALDAAIRLRLQDAAGHPELSAGHANFYGIVKAARDYISSFASGRMEHPPTDEDYSDSVRTNIVRFTSRFAREAPTVGVHEASSTAYIGVPRAPIQNTENFAPSAFNNEDRREIRYLNRKANARTIP